MNCSNSFRLTSFFVPTKSTNGQLGVLSIFVLSVSDGIGNILGAFPIQEKTALNEDYDKTKITGALIQGEEYPGCPCCGTKGFFYCSCGKLNCWNGKSRIATCNWCGATGELSDGIDSISITGNI